MLQWTIRYIHQLHTVLLGIHSRAFLGLVIIARAKHPAPFRTRQLSAVAPMVLRLKAWESRSSPNLVKLLSVYLSSMCPTKQNRARFGAGWSSPVARQAHNLKVVGSNPTPATKLLHVIKRLKPDLISRVFAFLVYINATSTPHQKNRIAPKPSCAISRVF